DALRAEELLELLHLLFRDREELAGLRVLLLRTTPRIERIAAIEPAGDAAEFLLNESELAKRDGQEPLVTERDPVFELQFLLEPVLTQTERRLRPRREVGLEVVDVTLDRAGRLG